MGKFLEAIKNPRLDRPSTQEKIEDALIKMVGDTASTVGQYYLADKPLQAARIKAQREIEEERQVLEMHKLDERLAVEEEQRELDREMRRGEARRQAAAQYESTAYSEQNKIFHEAMSGGYMSRRKVAEGLMKQLGKIGMEKETQGWGDRATKDIALTQNNLLSLEEKLNAQINNLEDGKDKIAKKSQLANIRLRINKLDADLYSGKLFVADTAAGVSGRRSTTRINPATLNKYLEKVREIYRASDALFTATAEVRHDALGLDVFGGQGQMLKGHKSYRDKLAMLWGMANKGKAKKELAQKTSDLEMRMGINPQVLAGADRRSPLARQGYEERVSASMAEGSKRASVNKAMQDEGYGLRTVEDEESRGRRGAEAAPPDLALQGRVGKGKAAEKKLFELYGNPGIKGKPAPALKDKPKSPKEKKRMDKELIKTLRSESFSPMVVGIDLKPSPVPMKIEQSVVQSIATGDDTSGRFSIAKVTAQIAHKQSGLSRKTDGESASETKKKNDHIRMGGKLSLKGGVYTALPKAIVGMGAGEPPIVEGGRSFSMTNDQYFENLNDYAHADDASRESLSNRRMVRLRKIKERVEFFIKDKKVFIESQRKLMFTLAKSLDEGASVRQLKEGLSKVIRMHDIQSLARGLSKGDMVGQVKLDPEAVDSLNTIIENLGGPELWNNLRASANGKAIFINDILFPAMEGIARKPVLDRSGNPVMIHKTDPAGYKLYRGTFGGVTREGIQPTIQIQRGGKMVEVHLNPVMVPKTKIDIKGLIISPDMIESRLSSYYRNIEGIESSAYADAWISFACGQWGYDLVNPRGGISESFMESIEDQTGAAATNMTFLHDARRDNSKDARMAEEDIRLFCGGLALFAESLMEKEAKNMKDKTPGIHDETQFVLKVKDGKYVVNPNSFPPKAMQKLRDLWEKFASGRPVGEGGIGGFHHWKKYLNNRQKGIVPK